MFAAMWCLVMINFAANKQTKPKFIYETELETDTEAETETELEVNVVSWRHICVTG